MSRGLLIALALVGVAVWGTMKLFTPATNGISAEMFAEPVPARSPADLIVAQPGANHPNIIVILADDLGYGDIGTYGGEVIRTPHIDQLAAEGMIFTNAYASASVCSPSRAGLLTGRYPLRSGIVQAMQAAGDSFVRSTAVELASGLANLASIDMPGGANMVRGLPLVEITIPEALKIAGYRTAAFGKWHLGDFTEWKEFHPYRHGFDYFVGFNMSNDDWPVAFFRGEEMVLRDIGIDQAPYTGLFTQEAVKFIEQESERPFFVYLAQKDPHLPFFPSAAFKGKSDGGPYGDAVSEFDWSIGEIVAALRRKGIADRTLVIVTSDNGPWFEGSTDRLRGRKGQSYEGGFRVPMVAWWPGVVQPHSSVDTPVMNIDFFPTFAALAGIGLPTDRVIDGRDISPLLKQQVHGLAERPLFFFHDYDIEGMRKGDWKYLARISHYVWPFPLDKQDTPLGKLAGARDYTPPGSEIAIPTLGTWPLLYHISRDQSESYNVAQMYPHRTAAMGRELERWKTGFLANPRQIAMP